MADYIKVTGGVGGGWGGENLVGGDSGGGISKFAASASREGVAPSRKNPGLNSLKSFC